MYLLTIALLPPRTLPAASLFSQTVPPVFASNLPFLLILLFPSLTIYPPSLCPPILRLSLSTYPSSKFLRHDSANNQTLTPFSGEILIFLFSHFLWESNLVADKDVGKVKALQQIHAYLFGGLYDFAGKIRTKTISKGNTLFCLAEHLHHFLKTVESMPETTFDEIVEKC